MSRAEHLHDVVVAHVRAWAAEHWPDEPVAALGLAYGAGWAPIPVVGLATVAEWGEWLSDPEPWGIGLTLWNPGEYSIGGSLPVPEQAALIADDLRDAWEEDRDWLAFIGGVARALAASDWSSLPTSEEFVVFANTSMDINEQHELETQLKATIPPALLDRFRARGLLDVAPPE